MWCAAMVLTVPVYGADKGPSQEELRSLLGEALMAEGHYDESMAEHRKVLEKDPGNVASRIALADMLSWQKKYPEAIAEYEKAGAAASADPAVRQKLARVYAWNGEYDKAIALYAALRRERTDIAYTVGLAEVYVWQKKYDTAKPLLEEALRSAPKDADARFLYAKVLQYSGDTSAAAAIYRELLDEQEKGTGR